MAIVSDTTQLAIRLERGDSAAAERLVPHLYDELRTLAAAHLRRERRDHTLQPTALVHEAFLRLVDSDRVEWRGRAHFMALAAEQIRRILVDHARRRGAAKRGGRFRKTTVAWDQLAAEADGIDLLTLNEAMAALADRSLRQCRVVELRFFGGLGVEDVAHVLGISDRTVKDDWRTARAWLRQYLQP